MNIREKVARAIYEIWWHKIEGFAGELYYGSNANLWQNWSPAAAAAINAFLAAAAEEGWHMRPDEATEEMIVAGGNHDHVGDGYEAMHNAAPKFEWKSDG